MAIWLIHDGAGSVGRHLLVLGGIDQQMAVMVDTWWYWVSIGQDWLILGGTRLVEGGTG